jgi:hypothetical protein
MGEDVFRQGRQQVVLVEREDLLAAVPARVSDGGHGKKGYRVQG